jgi:hypothetical protein
MPPSILALVGSPYQALGLLEYVHRHRITRGTVFLPVLDDLTMLRPSINVLMHLRGFTFHLRRSTGFRQPVADTGAVAEKIAATGRADRTVDTVVIGDYRDTSAWRVASLLEKTGSDVVVLDDGASTLAIDRSQGGFAPLKWSEEAERGGFMPQPAVTFFTSMPGSLRAAPGDTIVANSWPWLKSQYRDLRQSASLVLVIGQGFSRVKLMDEQFELENAHRLVAAARELHPGCHPLYVAHRGESIDKLRAIAEVCDVARFDIPLELVPVEAGLLPRGIVGHYSTAMTSLATLAPPELAVHAQRLQTDLLLSRGDYVADAYRRLELDFAGRITFID